MSIDNFNSLATYWLDQTGGHLCESTKKRYQMAIREISKVVISLNGELSDQLHQWQTNRRGVLSSGGFRIELGVVKAVLEWGRYVQQTPAEYKGWNEIYGAPVRCRSFNVPNKDDVERVLGELRIQRGGAPMARFLEFLARSGCRHSEAVALQWQDVDFRWNRLLIGRDGMTKTHKSRTLPLFEGLKASLYEQQKSVKPYRRAATEPIFGEMNAAYRLDQATDKLGLPRMRPHHDFRHFACVEWLKAVGINNAQVAAQWAGHSVVQFLERYSHHISESQSNQLATLVK